MEYYIGEVTTVKRNIVTGKEITTIEKNTQMNGMFRNLTATSAPGLNIASATSSMIYISDNTNILNRQSNGIDTTAQTFSVGGTSISGEFWPQYSLDSINNRAVFTWKQRFQPPAAGSRTINTIALYGPSYGAYVAALKLQTPCIQTNLDILDVFYKIYVYYDPVQNSTDKNVNNSRAIYNNLVTRWFYSSNCPLYAEGTSTVINTNAAWYDNITLLNTNVDLRYFTASYMDNTQTYVSSFPWMYFTTTPTSNTVNNSQGTVLKSLTMATTAYVGVLINKLAVTRWDYSQPSGYGTQFSSTPILASTDSKVQSVYLKSASSTTTNFAYLDPSTIGSSTATLVLNDANWTDPEIPMMFKLNVVQGGSISNATYKISMRRCFGFANNFFNTERPLPLNNVLRRLGTTIPTHINNTYNGRGYNTKRVDDKNLVTVGTTGITVFNVYTQEFTNFDNTTTPALISSSVQDAIPMPDGSILITTLDAGLLKLSANRTSITKFTGIGSGVNDNVCYAASVKFNGDIWAVFEGAIARYNSSGATWTIYNSSTPITFIHSEYNPTWSNTLAIYCRKDSGGDEILLSRLNSNALTWWSPSSPTPVSTTPSSNMSINKMSSAIRADFSRLCANLPGTSTWFIPNTNTTLSRMTFGSNTATIVSTFNLSSYYPVVLSPMLYNGNWIMRSIENPNTSANNIKVKYYNDSSTIVDDTNVNTIISFSGSTYYVEIMDDYTTSVAFHAQGTTNINNAWIINPINPLGTIGWKDYGWNSSTNQWELGHAAAKPVHNTLENLPNGIRCSFTPTGSNDFITGERWIGYLFDGLHKDNSTSAVLNTATHSRNGYITTDISSNTVPSTGLGTVTENISMYTLLDDRYSWNGSVASAGALSNTTANSMKSELWFAGDFTYNFYTSQYAATSNNTNSTCYMALYERDVSTPTSKWAFQFRNDGYLVTEDDVTKTSRVLPGSNDKFTIKRVGSTITYLVNDVLVYTSTITSSNPLRVMVRMPPSDTSRTFYDMKATYSESRRVLRIGNAINQTGIYDTRFAMIETWLTNPRTSSITINGVAATILTDPLATPAVGQVLVLQKNGMLIFNPSDSGKTVTCQSLVLLET